MDHKWRASDLGPARDEAESGLGSSPSEVLGLKTDAGGVTRNAQSRSARATRRIGLWAESDYPHLKGVLDVKDFNERQSGQRTLDDDRLAELIEIISRHRLGLLNTEPDVLGRAYEYLLRKFAEGQGQSAGEFYTPKEVGWLMAELINPTPYSTIYDPTCGSGELLIKPRLLYEQRHPDQISKAPKLFGQELNPVTFARAKMNMFLHDFTDARFAIGDTFRNPGFAAKGAGLRRFDYFVANPMLNSDDGRAQLLGKAKTSSGLHSINSRLVADLKVPLPPRSEQDEITSVFSSCNNVISGLERETRARRTHDRQLVSRTINRIRGNRMSERSAVQNPMLKYASQIGWEYVDREEALRLRGGDTGICFTEILESQLLHLNSGVVNIDRTADIIRRLNLLQPTIEGNRDSLAWMQGEQSVFVSEENRERNVNLIDFETIDNNVFHVTDEWTQRGARFTNRGDVVHSGRCCRNQSSW